MSAARPDTWMPLYVGDYLSDTLHLTRDQHGAYLLLIIAYWRRGEPLPDDEEQLAAIAKATPAEWRKRLRPILAPFFDIGDGMWRHKRVDTELEEAVSLTEARREAGRRGGEAARGRSGRKPSAELQENSNGNSDEIPGLIANPIASELQKNTPSPSPSPSEVRTSSVESARDQTKSKRRTGFPADWKPDAQDVAYAKSKRYDQSWIDFQGESCRDFHIAKGNVFADLHATWRTWVKRAPEFARGTVRSTAAAPEPPYDAERYRQRGWVNHFLYTDGKTWRGPGPNPLEPGCYMRKAVLEEFHKKLEALRYRLEHPLPEPA